MKFFEKIKSMINKSPQEKLDKGVIMHNRIEKIRSQSNDNPPPSIPSIKAVIHNDRLSQGALPIYEGCDDALTIQEGKVMKAPRWGTSEIRVDGFELSSNSIDGLKTLVLDTIKMLDDASENQVIVVVERQAMVIAADPDNIFSFEACYFSTNSVPVNLLPRLQGFGWGLDFNKIYPNNYLVYDVLHS